MTAEKEPIPSETAGAARNTRKRNKEKAKNEPKPEYRFGIGEWYGKSFVHLTGDQRRQYAALQLTPKENRPKQPCPFLSRPGKPADCHKDSGICSLRSYERSRVTSAVTIDSRRSNLVTTCPSRFEQDGTIYQWVNQAVLPGDAATPIGETPFSIARPAGRHHKVEAKAGAPGSPLFVSTSARCASESDTQGPHCSASSG